MANAVLFMEIITMHLEGSAIDTKCKQNSKVLPYSSFAAKWKIFGLLLLQKWPPRPIKSGDTKRA